MKIRVLGLAGLLALLCALTVSATANAGAVEPAVGCQANLFPGNDDGSIGPVPIGFDIDFFGSTENQLWVNNNGNVTFDGGMSTFTPFDLNSTNRRVIAPFFADVDTRSPFSGKVRYGSATFAGRPAFCVNWVDVAADLGVGYYNSQADRLNEFQLFIVDRSDVGPGDFDIVFNYDQIQWEAGSASGGSGGLGGSSARAGFSNGIDTSLELPGSAVNGGLLDTNLSTGLVHNSANSLETGRYVFRVRNGAPPTGGTVFGFVTESGTPQVGAPVQLCKVGPGALCLTRLTNSTGRYQFSGVESGDFTVQARPPAGSSNLPSEAAALTIVGSETVVRDLVLGAVPGAAPAGTSLNGQTGVVPRVVVGQPLELVTTGCSGGSATYTVTGLYGGSISGSMVQGPSGTYTATFSLPFTGPATVTIAIDGCPPIAFSLYIDPSGNVRTPSGRPVEGATVTLYRSDSGAPGSFEPVADGSAIMSPANRENPDLTDETGHFGWDVIPGYYLVRAEKADCHAVGNPGQPFVETDVLPVPPIWLDLDLRLEGPGCPDDVTPPVLALPADVTVDATGPAGASVTYEATAHDEVDGPVAPDCAPASGALFPIGTSTVTCTATDAAGNTSEPGTFSVHVLGAEAQLGALAADSRDVGPGQSLERKARSALADVSAGDLAGACETLTGYLNEVRAQTGKSVPAATAAELSADAARIMTVLGC